MIELYHGSNLTITEIDLSKSKKGKDFGCGFYLNPNKEQAMEMAIRTTKRMTYGSPIVSCFMFDLSHASEELNIKVFDDYSIEWAEFILSNRRNKEDSNIHNFDVVIGPIADDTVGLQMHRYLQGYIGMDKMIEELRFRPNPTKQYFFGTQKSLNYLTPVQL
ncbi:MAG: DUF3990 domain-containing protein [Prevotella sp.]